MTSISDSRLRPRDLIKLIGWHLHEVKWDSGVPTSEWVYASTENKGTTERFLNWLESKGIEDNCKAQFVDQSMSFAKMITWGEFKSSFCELLSSTNVYLVSTDMEWILEWKIEGVARFGQWVEQVAGGDATR